MFFSNFVFCCSATTVMSREIFWTGVVSDTINETRGEFFFSSSFPTFVLHHSRECPVGKQLYHPQYYLYFCFLYLYEQDVD